MKNALIAVFAVLFTAAATPQALDASTPVAEVSAGAVKITVTYKGKGTVDSSHKLWVYLFDTPNIGASSEPIDQMALDTNGADAVFDNVAGDKVYVAVAFDEKGAMMGDGPPPTGSPIGILMGPDGTPNGIPPGGKAPVALNFDDTIRMP